MTSGKSNFGIVEIVSGRVYRLGGVVRNDGRLSWAPPESAGWLPINCYLLTDGGHALLIDTGPAAHKQQILLQLRYLISPTSPLSVFLTRAEADCIGNLDEVVRLFNVVGVYSGGRQNPFDFIDDALSHVLEDAYDEDTVKALSGRQLERKQEEEGIEIAEGRMLHIHAAPLRILTTFWLYDNATKTLFTSDFLGHNLVEGDDPQVALLTSLVASAAMSEAIDNARRHMYRKFEWMAIADKVTLNTKLTGFLMGKEIEFLAPTHGRVVAGREIVDQQVTIVGSALWG